MGETPDKVVSVGNLKFPTWDSPGFRRVRMSNRKTDGGSSDRSSGRGEAGKTKWEMREHSPEVELADAVVLATARELDAKVLTGDPDFLVEAFSDEVIDVTDPNV